MARDRKDRSASWFIAHHGGSLLRLANITNFVRWHAAQTVLAFPKQIPDGLLDVTFPDKASPDPFLIEIETYPEQDTVEQIRKDLAMVLLTRGIIPDILLLLLRPKGNLSISPEQVVISARGLTEFRLKIHVVSLWEVPAEELLAAGDVGLIPWVPLAKYDGPPETLLQQCKARIEEEALPGEKANLLAMTRVMATERYNNPQLLSLLGGQIMSIEKVILQSNAFKDYLAIKMRETARETTRETTRETMRACILRLLNKRFDPVPDDVALQLGAIEDQQKLDELYDVAMDCPDLEAFRKAMS